MRTWIAGLAGAIAMFIWASLAHTLTPLATIGLQPLPAEAATITALHQSLGDKPGLYIFPFMAGSDAKAKAEQQGQLQSGPSGLLAYRLPASGGVTPRLLGVEFGLELIESLLAAVLIGLAVGFSRRLGVAAAIGLIAGMATNLSYWNWYGFSLDYSLANAFTELMKFVFAGAAIAWVLGWRRGPAPERQVA